jgi:hypothetical protein
MNNVMIGSCACGIGTTKKQKGKYLAYYEEGVKEPTYYKIKSMELSDPKFSIRNLFVTLANGDIIIINKEDINRFKSGDTVINRGNKGYYGVELHNADSKIGAASSGQKSCLTKEFRKLYKPAKRYMSRDQKVAIALNKCNVKRK